jgi:hypothetical protein
MRLGVAILTCVFFLRLIIPWELISNQRLGNVTGVWSVIRFNFSYLGIDHYTNRPRSEDTKCPIGIYNDVSHHLGSREHLGRTESPNTGGDILFYSCFLLFPNAYPESCVTKLQNAFINSGRGIRCILRNICRPALNFANHLAIHFVIHTRIHLPH